MDALRQVMPYAHGPSVKKLSKMATLLLARNFIILLTRSVEEMRRLMGDMYRQHLVMPTAARVVPPPPPPPPAHPSRTIHKPMHLSPLSPMTIHPHSMVTPLHPTPVPLPSSHLSHQHHEGVPLPGSPWSSPCTCVYCHLAPKPNIIFKSWAIIDISSKRLMLRTTHIAEKTVVEYITLSYIHKVWRDVGKYARRVVILVSSIPIKLWLSILYTQIYNTTMYKLFVCVCVCKYYGNSLGFKQHLNLL